MKKYLDQKTVHYIFLFLTLLLVMFFLKWYSSYRDFDYDQDRHIDYKKSHELKNLEVSVVNRNDSCPHCGCSLIFNTVNPTGYYKQCMNCKKMLICRNCL